MPVLFSRTFLLGKALLYTEFGMACVSWIAGVLFLIVGISGWLTCTEFSPSGEDLIKIAKAMSEKESKDLNQKINEIERQKEELEKMKEDEYLRDFYYFD